MQYPFDLNQRRRIETAPLEHPKDHIEAQDDGRISSFGGALIASVIGGVALVVVLARIVAFVVGGLG